MLVDLFSARLPSHGGSPGIDQAADGRRQSRSRDCPENRVRLGYLAGRGYHEIVSAIGD